MCSETSEIFIFGYRDGSNPENPTPGVNRSDACRHGFANARDDLPGRPRATAVELRTRANEIRAAASVSPVPSPEPEKPK